jgi:fatty acid desaturase
MSAGTGRRIGVEWPTLLLFAGFYGAFALLTWFTQTLPWWAVLPLGGALVCLHGSLQHEAIHGHPTPSPLLNELLVAPAVGLWMPYRRYARLHRLHHRNDLLTDPAHDPESFYLLPERWAHTPPVLQALYRFNNTLFGRLTIGPLVAAARLYRAELRRALGGERDVVAAWLLHLPAAALVLWWVMGPCGIPLGKYLACFVYPGVSLTLLRSFCEHRAHAEVEARTVVVEAGPVMSLLYLNNNLHAAHHENPALAWYRLPAYYRARRAGLLAANGSYLLRGYGEVFRRYFLTAKESVPHPLLGRTSSDPRLRITGTRA